MELKNETLYKNRFRILRKIGEGGSSVVYMAVDNKSGMPVTVKCIKQSAFRDGNAEEIIREETEVLRSLDHRSVPKVVAVYDDAFVLDYVPGNTLEKIISSKGKMRENEAVGIIRELVDIMEYLHSRKNPVIYRDLKPANIIIRPDGHVSLIDFGAARVFRQGDKGDTQNIGTVGFAAPEQFGSLGQTDPRTDIYCLGKTLEQIIKGKPTEELAGIIDKCTRPDREDRFCSCAEVGRALEKYPGLVIRRKVLLSAKIAFMAASASLIITFTGSQYENIRSYAAADARVRIPAVKDRLGNAVIRIRDYLEEKYGVVLKDRSENGAVLIDLFGDT